MTEGAADPVARSDAGPASGRRRLRLLDVLIVLTVAAIILALALPDAQRASSGSVRVPVRVRVFEAESIEPIAGARIRVVRAFPPGDDSFAPENRERLAAAVRSVLDGEGERTDADGQVVVDCEVPAGASHKRPAPHAHVRGTWVIAAADGYGGVTIPLRMDSVSTECIREAGELFVSIGLARTPAR
ncbi:MAG: hypothetical protein KF774_08000 [Planctomyces sp.]|nr:hypothetical protein [Planctomyces sp.]